MSLCKTINFLSNDTTSKSKFFFRKIVQEKIAITSIGSFLRKTHNFSWVELISREIYQISNLKQDEIVSNLQKMAKICPKSFWIWNEKSFREKVTSQVIVEKNCKSFNFYKSSFLKKKITKKVIWLPKYLKTRHLPIWRQIDIFITKKAPSILLKIYKRRRSQAMLPLYWLHSFEFVRHLLCRSCLKYQVAIIQVNIV